MANRYNQEEIEMKVVIIGAGIAGLTAGIYAQQKGFETEIYEKNAMPGGECTGWERDGYTVDNCIHWLTGCREKDEIYALWRNIGAIDDNTEFIREPFFYKLEKGGKALHFWSDLEKARAEFLTVAPEDEKEINRFFDSVKKAECVRIPCEKSMAEMSTLEFIKFGISMAEMGMVIKEYGKDSLSMLADRFKNPLVRQMILSYLPSCCKAIPLISSYAFYTSGTGAIPKGGSVQMVRRIVERYESLGGKIHYNMPVKKINIERKRAVSITLSDGTSIPCDFVISAIDTAAVFGQMLDRKYMDKALRKMYDEKKYHIMSQFNVSFGITDKSECTPIEGTTVFSCKKLTVAGKEHDELGVKLYDYDEELFPADKRVIQCSIAQDSEEYGYWQALYSDREKYNAEKQRIAEEVMARIVEFCPSLDGKLKLLSTYSPVTFTKWCGAYKGSYMSFFEKSGSKSLTAKSSIKSLPNVFIAGQWITTNGGLPIAATSGKFAVDALVRAAYK